MRLIDAGALTPRFGIGALQHSVKRCRDKLVRSRPISRVQSWTVIHLGRASPRVSSDLPGSRAGRTLGVTSNAPLFGLAPGGVYPATSVTGSAVRSYRTISPLPQSRGNRGGIFSVALSVGLRLPGVTWRLALWSPDFPLPISMIRAATAWPTPKAIVLRDQSSG